MDLKTFIQQYVITKVASTKGQSRFINWTEYARRSTLQRWIFDAQKLFNELEEQLK